MKKVRSYLGHRVREANLYRHILQRNSGPSIVFMPTDGRVMSSLLRVYNIEDWLNSRGWRTFIIPKQLEAVQRARAIKLLKPDLLFVQKSRHPLNDPALFDGIPFVYDLDDADFVNPALKNRMQDTVRQARHVFAGSEYVARWCRKFNSNVSVVWTGAPIDGIPTPLHDEREPIVTWAQSRPVNYPREFAFVSGVMTELARVRPNPRLRLYGWHETDSSEEIESMKSAGVKIELKPPMPLDEFTKSLGEVAVGLSPISVESEFSRGKSFGKILSYLEAKVPVVASDAADHAVFFDQQSGIVSNNPRMWVEEISDLLNNPGRRDQMSERAHQAYKNHLSLDAAGLAVEKVLQSVLSQI